MLGGLVILIGAALFAPWLTKLIGGRAGLLLAAVPAYLCWAVATQMPEVAEGKTLIESHTWAPSLGVDLALRLDGLSGIFLLLILGIGALILVYSSRYLDGHVLQGRFFGFVLFFLVAMGGMVASENVLLLFIFWELTGVASYFLIGFDHAKEESRRSALRALVLTGAGGLALLVGLLMIGQRVGSYALSDILQARDLLVADPLYPAILILILAGAFTKSAQVPFQFWLPGAMAAPAPVSALLHSATMVKAGVFLLGRFSPAMGGTEQWQVWVTSFGATTMFVGALIAVGQTDIKRLLAYSTVSALGTLTMLLGLGTEQAHKGAVLFLLVHASYKAALFMVGGTIDHATHTRDVRRLGGLAREMPWSATAAILAALAMCGIPPMLGFLAKEVVYEAALEIETPLKWVIFAAVAANVMIVAVAIITALRPFLRNKREEGIKGHELGWEMCLPPLVLALAGLVVGILPGLIEKPLVGSAFTAVAGEAPQFKLKLWHGFNFVLALSIATLTGGALLYKWISPVRWLFEQWRKGLGWLTGDAIFDKILKGLLNGGAWITRVTQHGYLRGYILVMMGFTAGLVIWSLVEMGPHEQELRAEFAKMPTAPLPMVLLVLFMCIAATFAAFTRSRLAVLTAFGVVGYGIAVIFAWHGAPDLALTQFFVETILLILMLLVICKLPRFSLLRSVATRVRDGVLSLIVGVLFTMLALHAVRIGTFDSISGYFMENALVAQGRNVVNVILVDFRALDTLGEAVVLAVAALGAAAVLGKRLTRSKGETL